MIVDGDDKRAEGLLDFSQQEHPEGESQYEDDGEGSVLDLNDPEELAKRGLQRVQIDGDDEEYLMDEQGNIYDLEGKLIGTANDEGLEDEEAE